ncbi:MAG: permease-like cell division protein FtsX [Gammaproteobacteria bacterium]|jgi:cell division transport system permease protein|nr:permease-like cell division protein FtsX [Gammaproteobacteria bacterium]
MAGSEKTTSQAQRSRPETIGKRLLREHYEVALSSWLRLWLNPVTNLLTWLTLAVALALPGTLMVMLSQVQSLATQLNTNNHISVFLSLETNPTQAQTVAEQLQQRTDIKHITFIPATAALQEFSLASGLGNILDSLTDNPIPATILVEPKLNAANAIAQLAEQLEQQEHIDQVLIDQLWLQRLQALVQSSQRAIWVLAVMLALGVLLVMGNTMRMQMEKRRAEILVIQLVGGTNAYLRRPFLYAAFWTGLLAGIIATAMMSIALATLKPSLTNLAISFNSQWQLHNLQAWHGLLTLVGSCCLAMLAALLTVQSQLRKIAP